MIRYAAALVIGLVVLCHGPAQAHQDDITPTVDIPYKFAAAAGDSHGGSLLKALVSVENTGPAEKAVHIAMALPAGLAPARLPAGWRAETGFLSGDIRLPGGYGQWFDLLTFDTGRLATGEHAVSVTFSSGDWRRTVTRKVAIGQKAAASGQGLSIARVVLPVDHAGNLDERMSPDTLVLRDKALDYYKSVLRGRGAYSEAAEAVHPLTSMNVEFVNPDGEEKLLTVVSRLCDREGRPVAGMFTPAASMDDREMGGFAGSREEGTTAFIALSGEVKQTVRLPVYIDENLLTGGRYVLRVEAREAGRPVAVDEREVTVIARDGKAAAITLAAAIVVLCGLAVAARCRRRLFASLKTRWLITITLFGAVCFAAVNVPATLLGEVLHVLLGPLAFLATGMFHGAVLYMLVAALVVLIPRPGVVALLFAVRMLLGLLAFGHASPVALLLCGSQAVLLESFLYLTGITAGGAGGEAAGSRRRCLQVALVCSAADGISTYFNLHALSFLYRVFYADWYIYAAVAVNGVLYSGIGGFCGVVLGKKLRTVGSD
jgi:hypothetical protein